MDSFKQFLNLQRELLESQLEIIKKHQRMDITVERTSKMDVNEKILKSTVRPMHISEIITSAQDNFQVSLERDSAVSAIIKKVRAKQGFIKTGPNTFMWQPPSD
jgi:DNA-directed RNA polymerase delta subunit